jgi:hypothetical protein
VVCSPVITISRNAEQMTWAVLRPGASPAYSGASADLPSGPVSGGKATIMAGARSLRLRDLRDLPRCEQRVQDEQGWSVFGRLFEGNEPQTPATAHVGATVKGGVSGPNPWRRPV